ncbi:acetyltransferase [Xylaria sp. CBS 124048]|nr:acetyltransferase [Xylaria sp. CBS 124048]
MTAHSIPKTALLITERCYLRHCEEADAEAMTDASNDLDIAKFMTNRFPSPSTLETTREWLAYCQSPNAGHEFGIFTLAGEFVGAIGIEPPRGDVVRAGTRSIGYYCGRKFRGRGFMTEVVRAFTRWAFANIPDLLRIEARVFEPNEGSKRVLLKAGFVREGKLRASVVKHGQLMGEDIFGLIRADLEA